MNSSTVCFVYLALLLFVISIDSINGATIKLKSGNSNKNLNKIKVNFVCFPLQSPPSSFVLEDF